MKKQIILKIYGRVQGVFFRDTSHSEAKALNLSGWVRNEPDGTVALVAEGEEHDLKEFIEWCQSGSDHFKVEKVSMEWLAPTGEFDDFVVK